MIIKSYSELITIPTFEDRLDYLRLIGSVGKDTFGFDRIFNQRFYQSYEWKRVRNFVIARDNGCDLSHPDYPIYTGQKLMIHHMNPISIEDINNSSDFLLNPEYLITVSFDTHNAIHYGSDSAHPKLIIRTPNDTTLWKKG